MHRENFLMINREVRTEVARSGGLAELRKKMSSRIRPLSVTPPLHSPGIPSDESSSYVSIPPPQRNGSAVTPHASMVPPMLPPLITFVVPGREESEFQPPQILACEWHQW